MRHRDTMNHPSALFRAALLTLTLLVGSAAAEARTVWVDGALDHVNGSMALLDITCDAGDPVVELTDNNGKKHTVTFCGSVYDPVLNQTTFKYKVVEQTDGLSHWTLGLCADIKESDIVAFSPAAGGGVSAVTKITPADPDKNRIRGIKWDFADSFRAGEFSVTLLGYYGLGETLVEVEVKGGGGNQGITGEIGGPDCNAVCDDSPGPEFDGNVIRDGSRRLIEVTTPAGATLFEFYDTVNLVVGDPEDGSGNPLAFSTSATPRPGTLYTLSAPATRVRFPLTPAGSSTQRRVLPRRDRRVRAGHRRRPAVRLWVHGHGSRARWSSAGGPGGAEPVGGAHPRPVRAGGGGPGDGLRVRRARPPGRRPRRWRPQRPGPTRPCGTGRVRPAWRPRPGSTSSGSSRRVRPRPSG